MIHMWECSPFSAAGAAAVGVCRRGEQQAAPDPNLQPSEGAQEKAGIQPR